MCVWGKCFNSHPMARPGYMTLHHGDTSMLVIRATTTVGAPTLVLSRFAASVAGLPSECAVFLGHVGSTLLSFAEDYLEVPQLVLSLLAFGNRVKGFWKCRGLNLCRYLQLLHLASGHPWSSFFGLSTSDSVVLPTRECHPVSTVVPGFFGDRIEPLDFALAFH